MGSLPLLDSLQFIPEALTLPVFLITGHACLCPIEGACREPEAPPLTTLPEEAFLISWASPEELFCAYHTEQTLVKRQTMLLQYLYHHSPSDVQRGPAVKYSLFDGIHRAKGGKDAHGEPIQYPNVAFTFNPDVWGPPEKNPYGVYRIDTRPTQINNTISLIPQNKDQPGGIWYLEDIIKTCYTKENVKRGLFLLVGCFGRCNPETPQKEVIRLERLIEDVNNSYVTQVPTLTAEELGRAGMSDFLLKERRGLSHRHQRIEVKEVMETKDLFDPEGFLEEVHPKNLPELLAEIGKYRGEQVREAFASGVPGTGPRAQRATRKRAVLKTMKQRIQHSKSAMRSKSRAQLLERVKRKTGLARMPAWAKNWLKRHTKRSQRVTYSDN